MATNVGTFDRAVRAVVGFGLLYLAFLSGISAFEYGLMKYGAAVIGVVTLVVTATRACPIYSIFNFKTCRV